MKNVKIRDELKRIADTNGGILMPEEVVRTAKNPKSVLHPKFEWDDTQAAHQHRLQQARELIAITVEILPGTNELTRTFVSLSTDRTVKGGGYRATVEVLSDVDLRKQLLEDALRDLNHFQQKFSRLKALAGVFAEIKRVRKKAA